MFKCGALCSPTFHRLPKLKVPTVAAIHGAALGGGYEVCLACDYRMASDDRSTRIGLPETSLGILPAWGGCTRLPRLIGLPKALNVILEGKRMPTRQALKYGLIDVVVPREHFERMALRFIKKAKVKKRFLVHLNNRVTARFLASHTHKKVIQKTRGQYPAVPRALHVITEGVTTSFKKSLRLEEDAVVDLVKTEACKNLVRLFFLREQARKKQAEHKTVKDDGPPGGGPRPPATAAQTVTVIGAGVMGAGISQWLSARGLRVHSARY